MRAFGQARLGEFLRARREALRPADVGLAGSGRRRTPGLRREELAGLAGLSVTWLTFVEQGREANPSAPALARLAAALRLRPAERAYMFELARRIDPAAPADEPLPEEFSRLLPLILGPAYILDPLWTCRGWNAPGEKLFSSWIASGELSLLRYVFLVPQARDFIVDWQDRARRLAAEFCADTARDPADPAMREMVARLSAESADFLSFWNAQSVLASEGGVRRFNHPTRGQAVYRQSVLVLPAHPRFRLVVLAEA